VRRNLLYLLVCSLLMLILPVSLAGESGATEVNAHYIARHHEQHRNCQFNERVINNRPARGWYCKGKNLQWRTNRMHEWVDFQREARQLRAYLIAVYVAAVRRALVDRWSGVAQCESGGNWATNTGNGYYGGLQFNLGTWAAYGGQSRPDLQPAWYQATIADRVRVGSQGLGAWPHCGRHYG
jgi:Transglycosylase-like domain